MFQKTHISFLILILFMWVSNKTYAQDKVFIGKDVAVSVLKDTKTTTNLSVDKPLKTTKVFLSKKKTVHLSKKIKPIKDSFVQIVKQRKVKKNKIKSYQQLISKSKNNSNVSLAKSFKNLKHYNYNSAPYSDILDSSQNQQLVAVQNETHTFITQHCIYITHTFLYDVKLTNNFYSKEYKPPRFS